ncbi:MAG: hypothetical protein JWN70_4526 [Planctomycetaceae bacterium]|nr:hypothetical protein [Planctomycetaceae bacterium]
MHFTHFDITHHAVRNGIMSGRLTGQTLTTNFQYGLLL